MIKEAYEKLRKKYSLPAYDEVNNSLEISTFESEEFLLRQIRNKIAERLESVAEPFASVLQPNADSIVDMHECRFFDDSDKKKMIEVYKKLMIFGRLCLEADIEEDEKVDAKIINDFFSEWKGLKIEMLPFIKKLKSCWEKETEIEEKLEYFG